MKKLFTAVLLTASMSANAQTICATLDYQEMKDMSPAELAKEYCENEDNAHTNMMGSIRHIGGDSVTQEAYDSAYDGCKNQNKRILRILKDAKPKCS